MTSFATIVAVLLCWLIPAAAFAITTRTATATTATATRTVAATATANTAAAAATAGGGGGGGGGGVSSVVIRLADYTDAGDAAAVGRLLNAYASDPAGDGKPLPEGIPERLASELAKVPGAFSVLGLADGEAVGLCNCFMGYSTFACGPLVNIHDVYVSSQARGLGICARMLNKINEVAKERGAVKITLEVQSNNAVAKRQYGKAGFGPYELDPQMGTAEFWQKKLR